MSSQPRRPSDARGLLHYYAMFNLKHTHYGPAKSYPVDSKILSLLPGFPDVGILSATPTFWIDGFRITQIIDAGFTDYVIEYDV